MDNRMEMKLSAGFALITIVIGILTYQAWTNNSKQLESGFWVSHTHEVLYSSQRLITSVLEVETVYRNYVLTGDGALLSKFRSVQKTAQREFGELRTLTADNSAQQPRIKRLESLIGEQARWVDSVIRNSAPNQQQAIHLISALHRKKMGERIRTAMEEFQANEIILLRQRIVADEEQNGIFNRLYIAEHGALIAVTVALFIMIYLSLRARKQTEAALREASEEIKDLYDNAPSGYYSVGPGRVFTNMNRTLLGWLGYSQEEVIGQLKYEDLLMEDTRHEFLSNFNKDFSQYKEKGSVRDREFEFRRKNGTPIPVLVNSVAIFNDSGVFVKSRSVITDYTEQKKAREKVLHLNAELEAFAYSVSHDLRAPLRSIKGYTDIFKEDYRSKIDEEGMRLIDVVSSNATRMAVLIDNLLEFSRLGRKELSLVKVQTSDLVRSIVQDFQQQQVNGTKVAFSYSELLPCSGDLGMLRQVWVNLISNAIKYSSKRSDPQVTIRSYAENGKLCYCVEDNGVGFDMKYSDKLFAVFQRLHKTTEFEGTGVGLALVKRIVNKHEGAVWAEGDVDKGARFYFSLPR